MALGLPIHSLLGGAVKDAVTPYASLLPTGTTLDAYQSSLVEKLRMAQQIGYRAAKVEVCLDGP